MLENKKNGLWTKVSVFIMAVAASVMLLGNSYVMAAEHTANITTDRLNGTCEYVVQGIDVTTEKEMTVKVSYIDGEAKLTDEAQKEAVEGQQETVQNEAESAQKVIDVYEQKVVFDETNCINGEYKGTFSMNDFTVKDYRKYTVSAYFGESTEAFLIGECDFSIHSDNMKLYTVGEKYDINRTFTFSTIDANNISVPGNSNKIKLVIWKSNSSVEKGTVCGIEKEFNTAVNADAKSWDIDLSSVCKTYGKYNASIVLADDTKAVLATSEFDVALVYTNVAMRRTAELNKQAAFKVYISGLRSSLGIKNVKFDIYNSSEKLVCSKNGRKMENRPYYYVNVSMRNLNYKLDQYRIKVTVTNSQNVQSVVKKMGTADVTPKGGTFTITKKSNATCKFVLKNANIIGGIKDVTFRVYSVTNGKEKLYKKFRGVYSKKSYIADMSYPGKGNFIVYAYATTKWNKQVELNYEKLKIAKSDLGKNGWIYETYAGKEYKFYYKNNEKMTDLTGILNIKNGSNMYIEINRAACSVTAYAYDSEKKDYIIPVKTFTVSVGRDTSTVGSASALTLESSFSPIGTYSVCSNGVASKYTLKTMNEPDGSVCYARWATHIVGNVYFHAIAVGSQSHNALNPTTYNKLGSPASAGCIRMTVADAKWIYDYAAVGTKVVIEKGDASRPGPLGKAATIKVSGSINYDPTDPEISTATKIKDYKAGRISGYMTKDGKKIGY